MTDLILLPSVQSDAPSGPDTLLKLLLTAIRDHVERLSVFQIGGLLMDAARQNDKRPAYIKVATLDSVVMNLKGSDNLRDEYLFVRIPREVVDWVKQPATAPRIIVP